jgi:DHA1 family inner membrane transport protein
MTRSWGALVALSVGAFSFVTTENLPVGLLPLIAGDLHRSPSAVGLLVTGYGLTVAATSVPLTHLSRRVRRRTLLAGLLAVFVLSSLVSAAASDYWMLLAARLVTALSQAAFWPVVAPTAANLFAPGVRGRVIAVVFAGASLATVLGVPTGTWLGQQAGWRVAFLALSGLGLAALLAVVVLLPNLRPGEGHAATGTAPDGRSYRIVVATTALTVGGVFTAYTYTVIFLTEVTGLSPGRVVSLLLVQGVAGMLGLAAVGALVDRRPRAYLATSVGLLAAALLGLYAVGDRPYAATALVALSGFALSGVPTGTQHRILQVAPGSTELASAWNGAAFNVGIAGGALVGGLLLPAYGVRATALAGGLLTGAALLVLLTEPLVTAPVGARHGP